jgi:hypothetical protein
MRAFALIVLTAAVLPGCAPLIGHTRDPAYLGNGPGAIALPPVVAYQNSTGPLSYRATSASAAGLREVQGESCQSALTFPVALAWAAIESGSAANAAASLSVGWGEGGYAEAVANALQSAPRARLVSARADLHTRVILGVWRQQCVRIVGSVVPAD